jgi:hypothetical protein
MAVHVEALVGLGKHNLNILAFNCSMQLTFEKALIGLIIGSVVLGSLFLSYVVFKALRKNWRVCSSICTELQESEC